MVVCESVCRCDGYVRDERKKIGRVLPMYQKNEDKVVSGTCDSLEGRSLCLRNSVLAYLNKKAHHHVPHYWY